jgi:hypothetical protein
MILVYTDWESYKIQNTELPIVKRSEKILADQLISIKILHPGSERSQMM